MNRFPVDLVRTVRWPNPFASLRRLAPGLAFLLAAALPNQAQRLWLVDPFGGSADFTSPQAAVDAAADGDVVMLLPGLYDMEGGPLVIRGKSLTLVADELVAAGAIILLTFIVLPGLLVADELGTARVHEGVPLIQVLGLAANQRVVLRNLELDQCCGGSFPGAASTSPTP